MSSFHAITKDRGPSPLLLETLGLSQRSIGAVLDLGCGSGSDSLKLVKQGWQVTSIDKSEEGTNYLKAKIKAKENYSINIRNDSFEEMLLSKNYYDLIYSSYALSFCQKASWPTVWKEITNATKVGGIISINLFGINDGFKNSKHHGEMTFFSIEDIQNILKGFKIITEHEDEHEAKSAMGQMKHWHIFTIIAQKL